MKFHKVFSLCYFYNFAVRTLKKLIHSIKASERALKELMRIIKALSRPRKKLLQYSKPLAVAHKIF
jgi:hypothetical protein